MASKEAKQAAKAKSPATFIGLRALIDRPDSPSTPESEALSREADAMWDELERSIAPEAEDGR